MTCINMGNLVSVLIGLALIVEGSLAAVSANNNFNTQYGGFFDFFTSTFWSHITASYNSAVLASIIGVVMGVLILLLGLLGWMPTSVASILGILTSIVITTLLIISASKAKTDPQATGSVKYSIAGSVISIGVILLLLLTLFLSFGRSSSSDEESP